MIALLFPRTFYNNQRAFPFAPSCGETGNAVTALKKLDKRPVSAAA